MDVLAEIKGIRYKPFLCKELPDFFINDLHTALVKHSAFILSYNSNTKFAISWWVSPKRTRSYPYARIYDTLNFHGKKVTIIPFMKDEGEAGDRDFLQWDTISLMSLLGVYVVISFYDSAVVNPRNKNKITYQRFNTVQILENLHKLLNYQSDALHWNLEQIENLNQIVDKALHSYEELSYKLGVKLHSFEAAKARVQEILKSKENFMSLSRRLAQKAQNREVLTSQPKEKLTGQKGTLTIKNYLGGYYYFTCDEIKLSNDTIYLIEGKHSKSNIIPSIDDIKDGLLKMILYTNLENVRVENRFFKPLAVLKLTSDIKLKAINLNSRKIKILRLLNDEATHNNFEVLINHLKIKQLF